MRLCIEVFLHAWRGEEQSLTHPPHEASGFKKLCPARTAWQFDLTEMLISVMHKAARGVLYFQHVLLAKDAGEKVAYAWLGGLSARGCPLLRPLCKLLDS